jgi:hypothetical protein
MERLAHYRKALAAFVGAVAGLLVAFGFDLTGEQTAAILLVVETVFVGFAPANAPKRRPADASPDHPGVLAGPQLGNPPSEDNDHIGWHWENGKPVRD